MARIVEAKLVSSAGRLDKLPEEQLPEVAFAGRSNVGKSSLLNALCNRKGLFKVSQTPGRTRTIVHVEARLASGAKIYLVDLPGYGFAKVSKGAQKSWGRLIEGYLAGRNTLHLVVLLVDVRRGLEEEENELLDFLGAAGVPGLLVGTKLDRLSKSKQKPALDTLRKETGIHVIGTSAQTGNGIADLLETAMKTCGYTS